VLPPLLKALMPAGRAFLSFLFMLFLRNQKKGLDIKSIIHYAVRKYTKRGLPRNAVLFSSALKTEFY
jgi:hypothetical protein